jgi:hypothetical protein
VTWNARPSSTTLPPVPTSSSAAASAPRSPGRQPAGQEREPLGRQRLRRVAEDQEVRVRAHVGDLEQHPRRAGDVRAGSDRGDVPFADGAEAQVRRAGLGDHEVGPTAAYELDHRRLEPRGDGSERDHRCDPDADAEDGQQRPHALAKEVAQHEDGERHDSSVARAPGPAHQ